MRVDVRQIKNIDQIAQTFNARVFIQFRIDGGALDEALCEGLNDRGAEPALRSARWFWTSSSGTTRRSCRRSSPRW